MVLIAMDDGDLNFIFQISSDADFGLLLVYYVSKNTLISSSVFSLLM